MFYAPFRGLYMSDLTFLDNGNPNFHGDGLINFSKCRLIYHQIRDLILRQVWITTHLPTTTNFPLPFYIFHRISPSILRRFLPFMKV